MAKQSLGRDLGTLMGKNQKQETTPAPAASSTSASAPAPAPGPIPTPMPVGEGVRSLIRGTAPEKTAPPKPVKTPIPRWYLFSGDVLLVVLALITLFTSPHPLSWQRQLFCAATVLLAAVLAVIALLPPPSDKP